MAAIADRLVSLKAPSYASESRVAFFMSNESVDAVVAGMRAAPGDCLLVVCGSGDQAFALASAGADVLALDTNKEQVDYALGRRDLLVTGDVDGFLYPMREGTRPENAAWFISDGRIARLRKRLDAISFVHGDVLIPPSGNYTGVYYSNAVGDLMQLNQGFDPEWLGSFLQTLPSGGKAYFAVPLNHHRPCLDEECLLPYMRFDRLATRTARRREKITWNPVVYRRL